jgi:AraC-like DNA-binding protein
VQHVEFFHTEHFAHNYHRAAPPRNLAHLIDFFWETKFDHLWKQYPAGFSDLLFPNTGYTYLINLGTPFVMQVGEKKFRMKTDGFLPRHKAIECYHLPGNQLFGIKFKISPVIYEKKINFSEYREYIYPLSYLMAPGIIDHVKKVDSFAERVKILVHYFQSITSKYAGYTEPIQIVSSIFQQCERDKDYSAPVEKYAAQHRISTRTLQRYFEKTTGISSKKALQVFRIRKATEHIISSPLTFDYRDYGYFDHSHFYKHLRQFLKKSTVKNLRPHIRLLELLHSSRDIKTND